MTKSFDIPDPGPLNQQRGQTFVSLVAVMQRLLAPDGCPWDREQDYASLRQYVMEEACEVIDAIEAGQGHQLCEELGDLALQVVFLAELGRRDGAFGPDDVIVAIVEKLVRRHPHVFADVEVSGSEDVLKNWEAIKAQEKRNRPLLASLPRSLPALLRAKRIGEKVSRVGFDWPDERGSRAKVSEELAELDEAVRTEDNEQIEAELGDLLFAIVNWARHCGVDPERALRKANDRFGQRFAHVEAKVREKHGGWPLADDGKPGPGVPLSELDGYWEEAKESR